MDIWRASSQDLQPHYKWQTEVGRWRRVKPLSRSLQRILRVSYKAECSVSQTGQLQWRQHCCHFPWYRPAFPESRPPPWCDCTRHYSLRKLERRSIIPSANASLQWRYRQRECLDTLEWTVALFPSIIGAWEWEGGQLYWGPGITITQEMEFAYELCDRVNIREKIQYTI